MNSHLRHYEQKYVKFYKKFSLEKGSAKERLRVCGEDLHYAFCLSGIDELDPEIRKEWVNIWDELTKKPAYNDKDSIRSSIQHSLWGKHQKSLKKYLFFFYNEYARIKNKVQ